MVSPAHPGSRSAAAAARNASLFLRTTRTNVARDSFGSWTCRPLRGTGRDSNPERRSGRTAGAAVPGPSWEHVGVIADGALPPVFSPRILVTQWSFDPVAFALIVVAGVLYWLGLRRIRRSRTPFPRDR